MGCLVIKWIILVNFCGDSFLLKWFIALFLKSLQLLAEESLPTTPFYFILGKHRQQQQDDRVNEALENELVQLPLTENIPAISEVSNY